MIDDEVYNTKRELTKGATDPSGMMREITATCAERGHSIRIIHEPEDDNKAHAAVRRMPRDDEELVELLAAESWCELILNAKIPDGAERAPDREASPKEC